MDPNDRAALALSAVALAIAIVVASTVTLERVNTRTASNDAPPGTVGLARPHPPLDLAPGEPIPTIGAPSSASIRQRP
ncbi:hypothetical protein M2171_004263 [Bradyrhizobium japonicum USDA 38]|jgi:hypothetical protein|uniref:Uncharacterized protein n=1 Tax=Bradyrhizobium japonicum TaxID=375 RepID=A0ABV2RUE5_BRAJP|nr:hypothetical protein [Bradyrhizobium japonicum]MCS3895130.1 hypothetical protein [Bradyrhizobium japonicum USDA 38]MCS3541053.1 hypothetical protein [Bradyrhizobium japonicum]MCS3947645.1 hypothetical protein [Bradyrhizobium japonicum]MCS3963366.1 hypothetical protein [Bradyrhizobium japonicum]